MREAEEVAAHFLAAKSYTIIAHLQPDGDAVGSVAALASALREQGKKAYPVLVDEIPEPFQHLAKPPFLIELPPPEEVDLCVVMDTPDSLRTGQPELLRAYAEAGKLILIDHHPRGELYRLSFSHLHNLEAASCAELVYSLLKALSWKVSPTTATALLTGMYTDTGGFRQTNTTSDCLTAAADMLRFGAKLQKIVSELHRQQTVAHLRLAGIALERVSTHFAGAITTSHLTQADFEATGASSEDTSGIINELNVLPESQFAMLLAEEHAGIIRGTLRTGENQRTAVHRLARLLGGGGHPRAAGFNIPGKLVQTKNGALRVIEVPSTTR